MSAPVIVRSEPPALLRFVLGCAAMAPPSLKGRLFGRLCAKLERDFAHAPGWLVQTNLGIATGLRCLVPVAKHDYAFGQPQGILAERATLALAKTLAADCPDFVDVGANEGVFTFLVHCALGGRTRLHWFEPDGDLFTRVEANLRANGVAAAGVRAAAAASTGAATFFKNLEDDASGSLSSYFSAFHETTPETVQTVALADYFERNGIEDVLLKIDVEGAGSEAWGGASRGSSRIRYLIMEMLEPEIAAGLPARIMAETGFAAYYVRDFDLVQSADGGFDYVEPFYNWLFCRLSPAELSARLGPAGFKVAPA